MNEQGIKDYRGSGREADRKNRTRRLIQLGALAEKYLHCEGVSPDEFQKLIQQYPDERQKLIQQYNEDISHLRDRAEQAQAAHDTLVKHFHKDCSECNALKYSQIQRKALLLACRRCADWGFYPGPGQDDTEESEKALTMQLYNAFIEQAKKEAVCRVCGCTEGNACGDGCYWVESDLCSSCADMELEEPGVEI